MLQFRVLEDHVAEMGAVHIRVRAEEPPHGCDGGSLDGCHFKLDILSPQVFPQLVFLEEVGVAVVA